MWQCRGLMWILFTRDLKAQYRQSYPGFVWLFVPIMSTTIIWWFLNGTRVIQITETPVPYPAYVLIGTLIWGVFVAAVNEPLAAFNVGRQIFVKLKVPPEAFIFSGLAKILFDSLIRILVPAPVFVVLNMTPASTVWLFPMGMACTTLIGLSIGFLMIPIGRCTRTSAA
jgi:lipopolysaccharide transport system permease protein